MAKAAPKFLSWCSLAIEWWSWCWAGDMNIYSNQRQYLIPKWECLRLEPNKLNKKTKIFTPSIVYKLTISPKRKTKEEILIACV